MRVSTVFRKDYRLDLVPMMVPTLIIPPTIVDVRSNSHSGLLRTISTYPSPVDIRTRKQLFYREVQSFYLPPLTKVLAQ